MADIIELTFVADTKPLDKVITKTNRIEKEIRDLAVAYQKGRITINQYDKQVDRLASSLQSATGGTIQARNAVLNYSRTIFQAAKTQGDLIRQMDGATGAILTQANATQRATKGAKQFGSIALQQVGYQVSDFAVQVQSGTSALVAFGQQGSQLAGLLFYMLPGAIGAAVAAVVSIAIPVFTAFGNVLFNLGGQTKDTEKAINNFVSSLNDYRKFTEIAGQTTLELKEEFGSFADEVKRTAGLLANVAVSRAFDNLNTGPLLNVQNELGDVVDQLNEYRSVVQKAERNLDEFSTESQKAFAQDTIRLAKEELDSLAESVGLLPEEAERFNSALSDLQAAETLEQVRDRSQSILDYFSSMYEEGQKIPGPIADALKEIEKMRSAAARATSGTAALASGMDSVAERARNAAKEVMGIFRALRMSLRELSVREAGIAAAKRAAESGMSESQTRVVQASASKEAELKAAGVTGAEVQQGIAQAAEVERRRIAAEKAEEALFSKFDTGTSGVEGDGGISAAEKQAQEFEKLKRSLDDAYASQQKFNEGKAVLDEALKSGLIPTTEEYKRLLGLLREEYDLTTDKGDNFAEDMAKIAQKAKDAMGDAFMSIVDGSKSAGDAFKDMARIILKQAFELLVVKPIMDGLFGQNPSENGIGGLIGSILGQKNGGAWSNGVQMYANGGVVTAPTGFQHSGGLGVMGEAGPEAIMPLKRGKNGKLGVQVEGGSQGNVTVENHFHIAANGDDSVKRIIAQEAPKIANLTQKQILDQRARGGAFRTTFG